MYIKRTAECPEILANDGCRLRELLHPRNDPVHLPFSLARAVVDPGKSSYRHRLAQTEVYYLLEGSGILHVGSKSKPVCAGDVVLIRPGEEQWIENPGPNPLVLAALVSPPWRAEDDERL